ncbi:MAG: hypothetical protein IKG42_01005, partial [Clostridia bacterium]|nr:hypothetical protein [Clostridia bacterium]
MKNVLQYLGGRKEGICQERHVKNYGSNFYHVMVQGINKEYIFENNIYIQEYKKIIISKLKDSNINILAY